MFVLRAIDEHLGPAMGVVGRSASGNCHSMCRACQLQILQGYIKSQVATTSGDSGSALWGELLSTACRARGAVGAVLDGLTRDTEKILDMDFPVFASGFTPLDSKGRLDGLYFNKPIKIGDCLVEPGDWVFADIDGVVVVPQRLAEQAFAQAMEKVSGENKVREELAAGKSVRETFAKYGIL